MESTISTKWLVITPMRILVRLVLKWKKIEIISRFSATLSAIGCTSIISQYITLNTAQIMRHEKNEKESIHH